MASEQEELRLDLEDLRHLESIAKRPRVLSLVSSEIRRVDAKLSKVAAAAVVAPSAPASVEKASNVAATASPPLSYTNLSSFSWDQDNDKITIYVFLEGVEQEKVEAVFKSMSVDIKFHDVQGKNYRCAIPKLNKEISPDKCKMLVKPNKVIITLFKASKGNWLDLNIKEDMSAKLAAANWKTKEMLNNDELQELFARDRAIGVVTETAKEKKKWWAATYAGNVQTLDEVDHLLPTNEAILENFSNNEEEMPPTQERHQNVTTSIGKKRKNDYEEVMTLKIMSSLYHLKPSLDKEKDPMAGIMDLMKNMYEEGDEDMKRVIAKSWSEARSGKAADPLRGFP